MANADNDNRVHPTENIHKFGRAVRNSAIRAAFVGALDVLVVTQTHDPVAQWEAGIGLGVLAGVVFAGGVLWAGVRDSLGFLNDFGKRAEQDTKDVGTAATKVAGGLMARGRRALFGPRK